MKIATLLLGISIGFLIGCMVGCMIGYIACYVFETCSVIEDMPLDEMLALTY